MQLAAVFLYLLAGPSVAATSGDPEVFYAIDYVGEGCVTRVGGDSSAVSVKGYVTGKSYEVFGPPASDNVTCEEAISCRIDPFYADDCTVVGHNFTHTIDAGQVVSLSSPGYNLTECHPHGDWYGDCNWVYKTLDNIKAEPDLLLGDYRPDLEARNEFIYLAFYEDDSCTDLATIVTSLSGQTVSVPKAMNNRSLSCAEASLCAVDPAAAICAERMDGEEMVNLEAVTRPASSNVYQCDASNEDVGQEECNEYTPTDCIKSSLYVNCHFRYLSGEVLGMNPRLLLGETTDAVETTEVVETAETVETTETAETTEPVGSPSSFAPVAGSPWLWTTLFALFTTVAVIFA